MHLLGAEHRARLFIFQEQEYWPLRLYSQNQMLPAQAPVGLRNNPPEKQLSIESFIWSILLLLFFNYYVASIIILYVNFHERILILFCIGKNMNKWKEKQSPSCNEMTFHFSFFCHFWKPPSNMCELSFSLSLLHNTKTDTPFKQSSFPREHFLLTHLCLSTEYMTGRFDQPLFASC